MFCTQCGASLQPNARFCTGCGQEQQQGGAAPAAPPVPSEASTPPAWSAPSNPPPPPAWQPTPPASAPQAWQPTPPPVGPPATTPPAWGQTPPAAPAWGQAPPAWGQAAPQPGWGAPPPTQSGSWGVPPAANTAPENGGQSTPALLFFGTLFICALQVLVVAGGAKLFGNVTNTEEANKVGSAIAWTALSAPYLLGGWLIAYRSVGRTILLAAIAGVASVLVMTVVAPRLDASFSFDSSATLGLSIIAFVCTLVGAFVGEHTPGHK